MDLEKLNSHNRMAKIVNDQYHLPPVAPKIINLCYIEGTDYGDGRESIAKAKQEMVEERIPKEKDETASWEKPKIACFDHSWVQ